MAGRYLQLRRRAAGPLRRPTTVGSSCGAQTPLTHYDEGMFLKEEDLYTGSWWMKDDDVPDQRGV